MHGEMQGQMAQVRFNQAPYCLQPQRCLLQNRNNSVHLIPTTTQHLLGHSVVVRGSIPCLLFLCCSCMSMCSMSIFVRTSAYGPCYSRGFKPYITSRAQHHITFRAVNVYGIQSLDNGGACRRSGLALYLLLQ